MSSRQFGSRPSYGGRAIVLDDDPRLLRPTAQAVVDFGYRNGGGEDTVTSTWVSAPWVTSTSRVTCTPADQPSDDHEVYDAAVEGVYAYAVNVVPGVGFDVVASAAQGTWGRYLITCLG